MSTKISVANTLDWEMFQRIWDTDLIHIRAMMRVGEYPNVSDLLAEESTRDIEIVLPVKWLREFVNGLDEYENERRETAEIVKRLDALKVSAKE